MYKLGKTKTNTCKFCDEKDETIYHLVSVCLIVIYSLKTLILFASQK